MPSKRKFYRTVINVVVLSEDEYDPQSLEQVASDIYDGDCSGQWDSESTEVDAPTMAKLLMEQASDPGFFMLTEDGEDTEDYSGRFGG